jgi:hypothetical protein
VRACVPAFAGPMDSGLLRAAFKAVVYALVCSSIVVVLAAIISSKQPNLRRRTAASDRAVTKALLILLAFAFGAAAAIGLAEPNSPLFPMSHEGGNTPIAPFPLSPAATPRFASWRCIEE